jgi:hypothetical protein
MKSKYYYIDKDGKKKEYFGAVIKNQDKTFVGYLTKSEVIGKEVILKHNQKVENVIGYSSYYSYINNEGKEQIFYGTPKFDSKGNPYFSITEVEMIDLKYYEPETKTIKTVSYIDKDGIEKEFKGKPIFENGSYYGII